jgi:small-conductance mechanosensitive channel
MVEETEVVQSLQTIRWGADVLPPLIAVLIGLIGEFGIWPWLHRRAEKREWRFVIVILNALRWHWLFWFVLLAVWLVLQRDPFEPAVISTIATTIQVLLRLSITIVVIQIMTWYVSLFISQYDVPSVPIVNNLIRVIGGFILLAVLLATLDYPIAPLLTVIAGSSLGLSFALRDPLGNLFSGLLLVASNNVRPGNYIRLRTGEEGYVTNIHWHTTTIRQLPNTMVIVPNSVMVSETYINFDQPEKELAILINMGVSYDSDLKHVERVTIEVGKEILEQVSGGVATFDPFIRYNDFSDSSINFTVILRGTEFVDQYLIKHEFIKRLHERYNEEGIVIPFPIRTLHTPQGQPVEFSGDFQANGNGTASHRVAEKNPQERGSDAAEEKA